MVEIGSTVLALSSPKSSSSSASGTTPIRPFERAKRQLLLACVAIGGGLAVAGSFERTTGGVLMLAGWLGAVVALHRMGRAGADRA